jgi:hypothetical protein
MVNVCHISRQNKFELTEGFMMNIQEGLVSVS